MIQFIIMNEIQDNKLHRSVFYWPGTTHPYTPDDRSAASETYSSLEGQTASLTGVPSLTQPSFNMIGSWSTTPKINNTRNVKYQYTPFDFRQLDSIIQ